MKTTAGGRLRLVLNALSARSGPARQLSPSAAFALVIWEQVAYLVDDDRRAQVFAALRAQVGVTPEHILAAPVATIRRAIEHGGMHPERRATRIQRSAAIAIELGDLDDIASGPLPNARRAFTRFEGIGEPGAEKVLLLSGHHAMLALDSNAVRVLLRLGYGKASKSYTAMYRSVQRAAAAELPPRLTSLVRAHRLLRRHGQELCRRTQPRCEVCPASQWCAYFQARQRRRLGG